jgi:Uma2 family endonuclease
MKLLVCTFVYPPLLICIDKKYLEEFQLYILLSNREGWLYNPRHISPTIRRIVVNFIRYIKGQQVNNIAFVNA